jgi:hypothetical protein
LFDGREAQPSLYGGISTDASTSVAFPMRNTPPPPADAARARELLERRRATDVTGRPSRGAPLRERQTDTPRAAGDQGACIVGQHETGVIRAIERVKATVRRTADASCWAVIARDTQ